LKSAAKIITFLEITMLYFEKVSMDFLIFVGKKEGMI
jgi:hypothetical protein